MAPRLIVMMKILRAAIVAVLCLPLFPARSVAQTTPAVPASALTIEEATLLTQGWAFLAQGELPRAVEKASAALALAPRSQAALSLAIEVEIARGGHATALSFYDQWLRGRPLEEPAILRRIARALLQEVAVQLQNPSARHSALRALAADGDSAAMAALQDGASSDQLSSWRALAALGSAQAVAVLVKQLQGDGAGDATAVEALGRSGHGLALPAVTAKLKDARPEVRAAAVDAVARLSGAAAIAQLRPMLKDDAAFVTVRAAKALFEFHDLSGEPLLTALLEPTMPPATRLMGVEALASRPDARWQDAVRALSNGAPPEIRAEAARLLATVDGAAAERVLDSLSNDQNPAVRELASRRLAESTTSLTRLRQLLTHADRQTRVAASARIIELTR